MQDNVYGGSSIVMKSNWLTKRKLSEIASEAFSLSVVAVHVAGFGAVVALTVASANIPLASQNLEQVLVFSCLAALGTTAALAAISGIAMGVFAYLDRVERRPMASPRSQQRPHIYRPARLSYENT
jgi:hypothetical protein